MARLSNACLRVALFAVLLAFCSNANAVQIWHEKVIARAQVGIEPKTDQPLYRVVVLGAVGPDISIAVYTSQKACVVSALNYAASSITVALDDNVDPFATIETQLRKSKAEVSPTNVEKRLKVLMDLLFSVMKRGQDEFKFRLKTCLTDITILSNFRLGLVVRICEADFNGCIVSHVNGPDRFEKIFEWLGQSSAVVANRWKSINEATGAPTESDPNLIEHFTKQGMWPEEPTVETLLSEFEKFALKTQKRKDLKLSYVAPTLMRLSLTQGRQVLTAVNAAGRALAGLRPANEAIQVAKFGVEQGVAVKTRIINVARSAITFSDWSDDVARVRIKECAKYRAITDVVKLGECAGYNLAGPNGTKVINSCLVDKRCLAEPTDQGFASVATLITYDLDDVTKRGLAVPRFGAVKLGDLEQGLTNCYAQSNKDPTKSTLCLVRIGASESTKKALDCFADTKLGSERAKAGCLTTVIANDKLNQQAKCFIETDKNARGAIACAAAASMPAPVRDAVTCFTKLSASADIDVIAHCVPGVSNDQKQALECLQQHKGSWSDAFLCYADKKGVMKPEVKAGLECASTNNTSLQSFAGCLAGKTVPIPGEVGKLVTCAAANGGIGLGTASCMVGDKLTAEQRILLQCASHSGDATSYAICVGGLLTFKEFVQCRNRKIGEGQCFGENNEIRKFCRNVFGQDIHKDTVVGQILNAHLEVVKYVTKPHTITKIGNTRVCLPWC